MNLQVFTSNTVQNTKSLLEHAKNSGLSTIDEVLSEIETYIYENYEKPLLNAEKQKTPSAYDIVICPYCNTGMNYITNSEKLLIFGCKHCRFSQIINEGSVQRVK